MKAGDITTALLRGPGTGYRGKMKIAALYKDEKKTAADRIRELKRIYGTGSQTVIYSGNIGGCISYDAKGVKIRRGYPADKDTVQLTWPEVDEQLWTLIDLGWY